MCLQGQKPILFYLFHEVDSDVEYILARWSNYPPTLINPILINPMSMCVPKTFFMV